MVRKTFKLHCLQAGILGFVLWLSLVFALPATVLGKSFEEYNVKAVFLLNLLHFVNWPATTGETPKEFTISILGNDPFGAVLDDAVRGERVNGRSIVIRRFDRFEDFLERPGEVVFVSSPFLDGWRERKQALSGRPVLSVADRPQFAHQGGMVNLLKTNKRIVLEINRSELEQAGISVSAKLLQLARLVP